VLVYVFETDAGPYLVDSGMDTPEIRAHHESRASRTHAAVPTHPATAWEIAQATRRSPLSETRAFTVLVVLSDLFARLTALTSRGALRQHPGTPARWSRTET